MTITKQEWWARTRRKKIPKNYYTYCMKGSTIDGSEIAFINACQLVEAVYSWIEEMEEKYYEDSI